MCMHAQSLQLCPTLCDPMECSPSASSVYGILQARILEWVAMPPSGDLPSPGIEPISLTSPALAGGICGTSATWEFLTYSQALGIRTGTSLRGKGIILPATNAKCKKNKNKKLLNFS